jgi:predicted porin
MKKLLTLAAVACSTVPAFAQSGSTVNLYGVVDAGISRVSGLKQGRDIQMVSGVMDGSRWGLRGNEDIGNGYRAIFTLENRLEINNGTGSNRPPSGSQIPDRVIGAAKRALVGLLPPATIDAVVGGVAARVGAGIGVNLSGTYWDRQAYVGLITPFGGVLAGRQYTPAYEVSAFFDTMQTQSSLAAGQVASIPSSIDIRVSNALAYRFQAGAFSGGLMYTVEADPSRTTLKGFSAMYKTAPFSVGLGFNTRKNELGQKSLTSTVVGASAAIGPGTVSAMVAAIKDDHPTGLSIIAPALIAGPPPLPAAIANVVQTSFVNSFKQNGRLAHVGYRFTLGSNTIYTAYTKFNDKTASNADVTSYGAAYSYAFSKRTDLNLVATHYNNAATAQAAPGQAGSLGGVTGSAGTDSNSFTVGLRHRF